MVRPLSSLAILSDLAETPYSAPDAVALGDQRRGFSGLVIGLRFDAPAQSGGVSNQELERRLLEMGFVEGARVELVHEGLIGRDPIAVRLDDMRVAMRRREARCVLARPGQAQ